MAGMDTMGLLSNEGPRGGFRKPLHGLVGRFALWHSLIAWLELDRNEEMYFFNQNCTAYKVSTGFPTHPASPWLSLPLSCRSDALFHLEHIQQILLQHRGCGGTEFPAGWSPSLSQLPEGRCGSSSPTR